MGKPLVPRDTRDENVGGSARPLRDLDNDRKEAEQPPS